MSKYGPCHRTGTPGGPGCPVASLPITLKAAGGSLLPANLLDTGPASSELELLRTVAKGLGINWGKDDLGWWAILPSPPPSAE